MLATDRPRYAPGDTLVTTIRSEGDRTYMYNLCLVEMERWTGERWVQTRAWRREDYDCDLIGYYLHPGQEASRVEALSEDLAPGTYRLTHSVGDESATYPRRVTVATAPFEVR